MSKKFRIPRKLKKKIPKGMYCYVPTKQYLRAKANGQYLSPMPIKLCKFYFNNHLGYGDCSYLFRKDNKFNGEENLDLCLNDQCKSCGINKPF